MLHLRELHVLLLCFVGRQVTPNHDKHKEIDRVKQDNGIDKKQIKVLYSQNNNPMHLGSHINAKVLTEKPSNRKVSC